MRYILALGAMMLAGTSALAQTYQAPPQQQSPAQYTQPAGQQQLSDNSVSPPISTAPAQQYYAVPVPTMAQPQNTVPQTGDYGASGMTDIRQMNF